MCETTTSPANGGALKRRAFFKATAALGAAGVIGGGVFPRTARADSLTREQRDKLSPDDIIAMMRSGNERFRGGEGSSRNFLREQRTSAAGQFPAVMILSCIDSRAPAEVIMDLGIGDAFNARLAGNIANDDILGSMEFATKLSGAKVILVMGHTACGAIKGAIDGAELGNLTGLLDRIKPAVAATEYTGERTAKNVKFVDAVAKKNVELTMAYIRQKSQVIRELESTKQLKIAGAMYNLETAAVEFFA